VERTGRAPLLPTAVYSDRSFLTAAVQGALFNFTFYGLLFTMSLMLQQGRGLGAVESGLLFLPLTGPIPLGSISAAILTRRAGGRAVLAVGQIVLALSLIAVVLTSNLRPLWPLVIALLPAGFSAGVLVPTMTAQSIAAVPPALHGATSAVFNTSRQVGAAIGIATFGPLLGSEGELRDGFVTCILIAAAATVLALVLTLINRATAASVIHPPVDATS
jgi:DHA2 family methylenomycin A resistance protein-like MFS transporter